MAVTKVLLAICVATAGLVQTSRTVAATMALPASLSFFLPPSRLLAPFFFLDGFSPLFLVFLHAISIYGSAIEHALLSLDPTTFAVSFSFLPSSVSRRITGRVMYIFLLLLGMLLVLLSLFARPTELMQPSLLGSSAAYFSALCSYLPTDLLSASVGVGGMHVRMRPWYALAAFLPMLGASSAMRLMPGYGAALFTSLLELFPTLEIRKAQPEQLEKSEEREGRGAREKAAAKGAKDNGKGRKAEADAGGAAGTGASVTDTPRGRRNGALATAAIVAALTHLGGLYSPPPLLAHARMHTAQSAAVAAATALDFSVVGVHAFFEKVNSTLDLPKSNSGQSALTAGQVLKVYQLCADFWAQQSIKARAFNKARAKRGANANGASNDALLAELERDLAEALSHVDFADPTQTDDKVLKTVLRDLARPELASLMEKERLMEIVAEHRQSHEKAHASLAQLGAVLKQVLSANASNSEIGGHSNDETVRSVSTSGDDAADDDSAGNAAKEEAESGQVAAAVVDETSGVNATLDFQSQLKETLGLFSIPLEMSDDEVLQEVLAGTGTDASVTAAFRDDLRSRINDARTALLEEAIARTVAELRTRIVQSPHSQSSSIEGAAHISGAAGSSSIAPIEGVTIGISIDANATARTEAVGLAVELLSQHDVDTDLAEDKVISDVLELVNLTMAGCRPGTAQMLGEAVSEWRRQAIAKAAVARLQVLVQRGLRKYMTSAVPRAATATATATASAAAAATETETETAAAQSGENSSEQQGLTAASPQTEVSVAPTEETANEQEEFEPTELQELVDKILVAYEVLPSLSDNEVLLEVLKLLNLPEQLPPTLPHVLWTEAAIVAYRNRASTSTDDTNTTSTNSTSTNSTSTNSTSTSSSSTAAALQSAQARPTLLIDTLGKISANRLLEGTAESVTANSFAILTSAVFTALGVHNRLAVLCDTFTAEDDLDARSGGGELMYKCKAVTEVRLGKNARKLAAWVAQHRKGQRALRKAVKGAKELHFRKDRAGYLWLPLRWQANAPEQLPGAPYGNYTYCAHFSNRAWEVEGQPIDSLGAPSDGPWKVGSVLCTL